MLLLKISDFVLDLTVSIGYSVYYKDTFIKDLPPKQNCTKDDFPIACFFHEMDDGMFGWSSFSIFLLMYLSELCFFMASDKTLHYRAILSGFCCTGCYKDTEWYFSLAKMITTLLLPMLNQIIVYVYDFFCKTFIEYWRSPASSKIGTIKRDPDGNCKRCKAHKNNMEEKQNVQDNRYNSICVFCDTKPGIKGERILLGDGKASDAERKLLEEIEKHKSDVTAISKLVTAATENSFMPLLQLSLVFPNFIALFPLQAKIESDGSEKDDNALLGYVENLDSRNVKFIIITGSIVTSLFSLAKSLTLTYFSKPGKKSFQTKASLAVVSLSIILQVIPKIFAYQLFAFGIIGPYVGANFIIPFILLAPMVQVLVFTLLTLFLGKNKKLQSFKGE